MPGTRRPNRRRREARHPSVRGPGPSAHTSQPGGRPFIRPRTKRRLRRWALYIAALVVAILVIGSFGLTSFPGLNPRGTGATSYKEGVGLPQPSETESANHILDGTPIDYVTGPPPVWGDHWSSPTRCGFYEQAVPDEIVLHNLEHGNVVMSYNLTDSSDVARLKEVHSSLGGSDDWLVTRPYDLIPEGEVAMTAWGILDQFTGVDEEGIKRFYKAYQGNRFSAETERIGRGIPCTAA